VQLRFTDELQAIAWDFLCVKWNNHKATTESSTFLPIPQLGHNAPEDKVTYVMMTAEVGLPDAV